MLLVKSFMIKTFEYKWRLSLNRSWQGKYSWTSRFKSLFKDFNFSLLIRWWIIMRKKQAYVWTFDLFFYVAGLNETLIWITTLQLLFHCSVYQKKNIKNTEIHPIKYNWLTPTYIFSMYLVRISWQCVVHCCLLIYT